MLGAKLGRIVIAQVKSIHLETLICALLCF